MKPSALTKILFFGFLLILVLSIVLAVVSFLPKTGGETLTSVIIDDSFNLTSKQTYRQGLGSFRGDETVTVKLSRRGCSVNFSLLTYSGPQFSVSVASDLSHSFMAGADYYEAVFNMGADDSAEVSFQVSVQKPLIYYPFVWLGNYAKAMFFCSWAMLLVLLIKNLQCRPFEEVSETFNAGEPLKKNIRRLQGVVLVSLIFWFVLLAANAHPLATFEDWYTDGARHPYTATLFTKVGFTVFDTPLGKLSSNDLSSYKFVTWAEMPHLYPLGSIFLFLPFGALLEIGVTQSFVFKLEIAFLILISHVCLYLFLKRFWNSELNLSLREFFLTPFWKQKLQVLKAIGTYLLLVLLVVYAANGQFEAVAFLFSLVALAMFLKSRPDLSLLFIAVAFTFKYQAGIFLFTLAITNLLQIKQGRLVDAFRNKVLWGTICLMGLNAGTAWLSYPFLINVRPELIMNGVNAFAAHAQISWHLQAFTILLTLFMTLSCALYLLSKSRLVSLFMVFSLLPVFSMPYLQPWYLPFFFVYLLIPQSKRSLTVTLIWLIFITIVLSFGGLAYNPLAILNNIRRILNL